MRPDPLKGRPVLRVIGIAHVRPLLDQDGVDHVQGGIALLRRELGAERGLHHAVDLQGATDGIHLGEAEASDRVDCRSDQSPAAQLRLEVDYGRDQDTGDRVIWANARLYRPSPSVAKGPEIRSARTAGKPTSRETNQ